MNVSHWLHITGKYLEERCSGAGRIDAEAILGHITGRDRVALYRDGDCEIPSTVEEALRELVERRAGGEPLAYITGWKEFMGLAFMVSPAVLIPRPETELLVEKAVELIKGTKKGALIADVGTGSGAVAVTLAVLLEEVRVYAIDLSREALEVAAKNAALHGVADRVEFLEGNLLERLPEKIALDLITANLPYIPSAEISSLMAGVRDYEPHLALDGGQDGLDLYRRLILRARGVLCAGGHLLMEIGPGQGALMKDILGRAWEAGVLDDLAGRERLVVAKKR
jgi:release factor glutamine methyltransferase